MASLRSKHKLSTCLWFDGEAEAAMKFYTAVFKQSKKEKSRAMVKGGPLPKGTVMAATFQILGHEFIALNGGPEFKFNESVSFVIHCATQKEIDYFWNRLTSGGGAESMCGWCKDKFGVSWQVVPDFIAQMMTDRNPARSQRVMDVLFKMKKLDIKTLKSAYIG